MSNDQEWQRLQGLYAAMSDLELLRLAEDKDGLTEVAQEAIDAEMSKRGLEAPAEEEPRPEIPAGDTLPEEGDPSLVRLITAQSAVEANKAAAFLEAEGIPFELRPQRVRETEDGPLRPTGYLEIVVARNFKGAAEQALREGMGLFPLAEVDEREDDAADSGEEGLYQVGNFELEEDAEVASKALRDAGIWFTAERITVDDPQEPAVECTFIEVRFDDLERAFEVVEEAFGAEE